MPPQSKESVLIVDDQIKNDPASEQIFVKDLIFRIRSNGIVLCVLSVSTAVLTIFSISVRHTFNLKMVKAGTGIWCSLFPLVLGVLMLLFYCFRSKTLIVCIFILAKLSSIFGCILTLFEFVATIKSVTDSMWEASRHFPIHVLCLCLSASWTVIAIYCCIIFGKFWKQSKPSCPLCDCFNGFNIRRHYQPVAMVYVQDFNSRIDLTVSLANYITNQKIFTIMSIHSEESELLGNGDIIEDNNTNAANNNELNVKDMTYQIRSNGIVLIVLSVVTFILAIVSMCTEYSWRYDIVHAGTGIWCSLFGLALGIIMLCFYCCRSKSLILWIFVFSIIASVFGCIVSLLELVTTIKIADDGYVWAMRINFPLHIISLCVALSWTVLAVYFAVIFGRFCKEYNPNCSCDCFGYNQRHYQPVAMVYVQGNPPNV